MYKIRSRRASDGESVIDWAVAENNIATMAVTKGAEERVTQKIQSNTIESAKMLTVNAKVLR